MKLLSLIVTTIIMVMSLQAQTASCGIVFNDTFDEAGAIPTEWTEYNTSGRITVENGHMKFNHNIDKPSAYRMFDPVTGNCLYSFDVQASRNSVDCTIDLLSSDGKSIAGILIGDGKAYIEYATGLGTYTPGVTGDIKFKTNTVYTLSIYVDFDNQTVDYYYDGVLTIEDKPFVETATDIAKVDIQLLYMYSNSGTFFFDNISLFETDNLEQLELFSAVSSAQTLFSEATISDEFDQFPEVAADAFEQAIASAELVLDDCEAPIDTVNAALASLVAAEEVFEARLSLNTALIVEQKIYSKASVGDHYVDYPQAAIDAFELVISAATSLLADADASTDNLIAALTDLQTAEATFIAAHNDPVVLTLFSAYDFTGEELGYKCGYYNGTLGDFDNKTVAFKLDSGYMVTFAQDVNGLGVSKVYIAQDKDLAINLPEELQHSISFIRVSPWYPVGKKGCVGNAKWTSSDNYNASWYYNWTLTATDSELEAQFVPMSWSAGGDRTSLEKMALIGQDMTMNHHLAFNEPDNEGQSNMTVAQALAAYPKLLASGLRLGAPGVENVQYSANADSFNTDGWIKEFMDSCVARGYRVDFIPAHDYVRRSKSTFIERFEGLHDRYGIPVWVTEYNYGNPNMGSANLTIEQGYSNIKGLTEALQGADFIERYNWYYFFGASSGIGGITDGELNITGQFYRDLESPAPSYIQDVYEDGPYIPYSGIKESQSIGSVLIYPNPADGNSINLTYSDNLAQGATVSLLDISGKEVLRQANSPQQIDVSSLQNGVYLLKVVSIDGGTTQKVLINK